MKSVQQFFSGIVAGILLLHGTPVFGATDIAAELGLRPADTAVRDATGWGPEGPIVIRVFSQEAREQIERFSDSANLILVNTEAQALAAMPGATVLIGLCTRELIDAAPKLHWIQLYSAGVESCLEALSGSGRELLLTNMQRVSSPQIAEHSIAMILGLTRGLPTYMRNQSNGKWRPGSVPGNERRELGGQTLLLVGLGGIGTAVGQRATALGMRVTAIRASTQPGPDFVSALAQPDRLLDFAATADVIVNSVPLTPRTEGLFDAEFFAAMKPTAYFINVGRGKSVVTDDLVAALQEGRLAGAGLDVTDPEPLPRDHPLWHKPNVIITPHVAAGSNRTVERLFQVVRENLRRYVNGEPMLSVVDPERGY